MPLILRDGIDERRQANQLSVNKQDYTRLQSWLNDVMSATNHSKDFIQTRNNYMVERLRLMCLFFAASVPLASLLDFVVFDREQATVLFINRIILSIWLIILFQVIRKISTVTATRIVLTLSFLLPVCFYISTSLTLAAGQQASELPLSFSMMPYLIIAMLGLFPLTITGGLALLGVITVPLLVFEYIQLAGNLIGLIDKMWLLVLFGGISLWLQSGQLMMLLKLYRESTIDPLTGLINRRVLMRQVASVAKKCDSEKEIFCVMMFDLDHFKRVNDTFGHMIGDKVLVKIAALLKQELRNSDIIARFGGEEFLVVMPCLQLEPAAQIALRVASAVRNSSVISDEGQLITFTTSIGVAQYRNNDTVDSLFKRVDDLLYAAKDQGRDRVICEAPIYEAASRQAS